MGGERKEAYLLACTWLCQSGFEAPVECDAMPCESALPDDDVYLFCQCQCQTPYEKQRRHNYLKRLIRCVRFQHMTPDFLENVVRCCPLLAKTRLLPYVYTSCGLAYAQPTLTQTLDDILQGGPEKEQKKNEEEIEEKEDTEQAFKLRPLLPDRKRGVGWRGWARTFEINFTLNELLQLTGGGKGKFLHTHLGAVNGYPVALVVRHEVLTDTVGVYIDVDMPGEGRGMRRSVAFRLRVRLGPVEKPREDHLLDDVGYCGWSDFFGVSWGEVVRKGSAYFPTGGDSFCMLGEVGVEALTLREEEWGEQSIASLGGKKGSGRVGRVKRKRVKRLRDDDDGDDNDD